MIGVSCFEEGCEGVTRFFTERRDFPGVAGLTGSWLRAGDEGWAEREDALRAERGVFVLRLDIPGLSPSTRACFGVEYPILGVAI